MGKEARAMVNSYGLRSGTRKLFAKDFRTNGPTNLSTYLVNFKVGDYVDVVCNASIHKGMPYKYYHGKTGRVFNVTPRAVGVEINKHVTPRGVIYKKRIHVRIEHVRKSRCREDFLRRVVANDLASKEYKKTGVKKLIKRQAGLPKAAKVVSLAEEPTEVSPLKYDPMY